MGTLGGKGALYLCVLVLFAGQVAAVDFAGGTGKPDDPYRIATAEQLIGLGKDPNLYDKCFILTNDIDLSGRVFEQAVIAPGQQKSDGRGYRLVGNKFLGSINGNGYKIKDLTIQGQTVVGLIGALGTGAKVSHLGLDAVDVNGIGGWVGGLVGYNSGGAISECYITGKVSGHASVGGLVGYNDLGFITNCYSSVTVSGNEITGGLVGRNKHGDIKNCYSISTVNGNEATGGLVGRNGSGIIIKSFWDTERSGLRCSDGGVGLSTAEMMDPEMLGLNGLANNPNWILDAYRDYPRLVWQKTPGQKIPAPTVDWFDGEGTRGNPYKITRADQIVLISKASILVERHFILLNELDFSGHSWPQAVIPYFNGSFDGQGFCIKHLHIVGQSHLGLFGVTDTNTVITNLGLVAVDVSGTGDHVGGLVGLNRSKILSHCYSEGTICGSNDVGGLVGSNSIGSICSSYSTGDVSGVESIGGLVGDNYSGFISRSYSTSAVNGDYRVGGLVGDNFLGGSLSNSYSMGSVNGNDSVGGLVGDNYSSPISNCYSTGTVKGQHHVGGLVGDNYFVSVYNSFWDMETSNLTESAGGTGLYTTQMLDINTYLKVGWDFIGESKNGTCQYWTQEPNNYPLLNILNPSQAPEPIGLGTLETPYIISNAHDLGMICTRPLAAYRMEANIDLAEIQWTTSVIPWFGGNFDANGFRITKLSIDSGWYLGLFGVLGLDGLVTNLGLDAVDVNGVGYVGGLAGLNYGGIIANSYSHGIVNGHFKVGGLVGSNEKGSIYDNYSEVKVNSTGWYVGGLVGQNNEGYIVNCFSTEIVQGDNRIGGLVGYNHGSILNCFSTGQTSGDWHVGGLVGTNSEGNVSHCYSTGMVSGIQDVGGLVGGNSQGSISKSFWDMETSGLAESKGGIGLTTAQMWNINTYLNAGWDFVDTWMICEEDYPHLQWERVQCDGLTVGP